MSFLGKPKYGFYAILDSGYVDEAEWEYTAESLLAGGACLLQVRADRKSVV